MATTNDRTIEANGSSSSSMEGTDLFMMTDGNGSFKRASVSDMVDALKKLGAVNGRNLVKRSTVSWRTNEYSMGALLWGEARPELGQQVTVTIWGELGSDRTSFIVFNSTGDGNNGAVYLKQGAVHGVYSGVMTLKRWNSLDGISIYQSPKDGTSVSRVDRVKVELGAIATDWTPAPEDIADLLTENRGGGVKYILPIHYALRPLFSEEKGGLQHERQDDYSNQRISERNHDRCGGGQREHLRGYGSMHYTRGVCSNEQYSKYPCRSLQLWNSDCLFVRQGEYLWSRASLHYRRGASNLCKNHLVLYRPHLAKNPDRGCRVARGKEVVVA